MTKDEIRSLLIKQVIRSNGWPEVAKTLDLCLSLMTREALDTKDEKKFFALCGATELVNRFKDNLAYEAEEAKPGSDWPDGEL